MNRRTMLAAMLFAGPVAARAAAAGGGAPAVPQRLVTLDWGLTEMILSLGLVPLGTANPDGFRRDFTVCRLPKSVVDVGLIFQPNMELLLALKPDLIIITPAHARLRASLERIAPTYTLGRYPYTPAPYLSARAEMQQMALRLGRVAEAKAAIGQADAVIRQAHQKLLAYPRLLDKPLMVTHFIDDAHVRIAGPTSLYGEMLVMLGLRNAWSRASSTGAFSTVGIESLGNEPGATLAYLQPLPAEVADMMKRSPLWSAMPFSKPGRLVKLPLVPPNGGVRSAAYFAQTLASALIETQAGSRGGM